jgi:hypothetical protein
MVPTDQVTEPGCESRLGTGRSARPADTPAAVAIAFVVGLLVLATTSQGAYAISRWAPLGLFVFAILLGAVVAGHRVAVRTRAMLIALGGIWGAAIVSLASMLWAQSAGDAFMAGNRMLLYAAIATLPFVLPLPRRALGLAGWAVTAGLCAVAVFVLVRLLLDPSPLFLAGRLNSPVNYRNATALLFAMPAPPCIVAAAGRGYPRPLRALALALCTLCRGLVFLTQSRGILIGLAAGEVVILALGPERVRRAWVSVVPLLALAIASRWLLRPFHAFDGGDGFVSGHDITVAAVALALASLATLLVGLLIALFDSGLRTESSAMRHVRGAARVLLVLGAVALVVAALVSAGNPSTYVHDKWDQFRSLKSTTPSTTRLGTVGGQRYDLWRVAVREFQDHPALGVGADNYSFGYYRLRRTDRNLDDPHSLVFSLLSETGAVGLGLFVLFVGGVVVAVLRSWRRLPPAARRPAAAALAAGAVFMGQSTVDWIWLIPGLTGVGVLMIALAAAQATVSLPDERRAPRARSWPAGLTRVTIAGALAVCVVSMLALLISDAYIQRARSVIDDPPSELSAARSAHALDPWSVTPLYQEASALESMGDRSAAGRRLHQALALEPANFATLGVIGDFQARGHDFAAARRYYRRALALDPLDTGLQQLARIGLRPGHHGARHH